jgi:C-terminal processing protease CtpA/Prc
LTKADELGFQVTQVDDDGPAQKAGLKVDDYIVAIDGRRVKGRLREDILKMLAQKKPYTSTHFIVVNSSGVTNITITPELRLFAKPETPETSH